MSCARLYKEKNDEFVEFETLPKVKDGGEPGGHLDSTTQFDRHMTLAFVSDAT